MNMIVVNGVTYRLPPEIKISDEALALMSTNYVSNGCGNSRWNTFVIGLLTSRLGLDLKLACYIHDAEYELLYGTGNQIAKVSVDSDLHVNVYALARKQKATHVKSLMVARAFHLAVMHLGGRSAGLNRDIKSRGMY